MRFGGWKFKGVVIAAGLLAFIGAAGAGAKVPTLDDYLRDGEVQSISLSPDGKKLALIKRRDEDHRRFYVLDVDNDYKPISYLDEGEGQTFSMVRWLNDNRLGLNIVSEVTKQGRLYYTSRMLIQSPDGSNRIFPFADNKRLLSNFNLTLISSRLPKDPDHILMMAWGQGLDLYKVNINDGTSQMVVSGGTRTYAFGVAKDGTPKMRFDYHWRSRIVRLFSYNKEKNRWERKGKIRLTDSNEEIERSIASFVDDTVVNVLERLDDDEYTKVYRYDMATQEYVEVLYEIDGYDIENTIENSFTGDTIGVYFYEDRPRYIYFDKWLQDVQLELEKRLPNGDVDILDISRDHRRFLLFYDEPWRRGTVYLYNHALGSLRQIIDMAPQIEKTSTTSVDTFRYKAKDETMIQAYLTLPAGREKETLPLIVYPHGGPSARDYLGYDVFVQYWVTRGYAVFQPNFRGSEGYGASFVYAGDREYGGEMIEDIASGVRALIRAGRVDPERICSVGVSYGGYASMMLDIKTDLLKCVVSINGPVDYSLRMKNVFRDIDDAESREEVIEWYTARVGDLKKDKALLDSQSPLKRAAELKSPLLLMHAVNDGNVDFGHAKEMDKVLRRLKKPDYTFYKIKSGGHSVRTRRAKEDVLLETEAFFYKMIGGPDVVPPPPPPEEGDEKE